MHPSVQVSDSTTDRNEWKPTETRGIHTWKKIQMSKSSHIRVMWNLNMRHENVKVVKLGYFQHFFFKFEVTKVYKVRSEINQERVH